MQQSSCSHLPVPGLQGYSHGPPCSPSVALVTDGCEGKDGIMEPYLGLAARWLSGFTEGTDHVL